MHDKTLNQQSDIHTYNSHDLFCLEVAVTDKLLGQLVAVCEPAAEDLSQDVVGVRGHHRRVGHVETLEEAGEKGK